MNVSANNEKNLPQTWNMDTFIIAINDLVIFYILIEQETLIVLGINN